MTHTTSKPNKLDVFILKKPKKKTNDKIGVKNFASQSGKAKRKWEAENGKRWKHWNLGWLAVRKCSNEESDDMKTKHPTKDPPDPYCPTKFSHNAFQPPNFVPLAAFRKFKSANEVLGPDADKSKEYKNPEYFSYHRYSFVTLQRATEKLRQQRIEAFSDMAKAQVTSSDESDESESSEESESSDDSECSDDKNKAEEEEEEEQGNKSPGDSDEDEACDKDSTTK